MVIVVAVIVTGCVVASTAQQRARARLRSTVPPLRRWPTMDEVVAPPGWKPDGHVVAPYAAHAAAPAAHQLWRAKYPAIDFHVQPAA